MTVRPALLGAFAISLGGHLALAALPGPWGSGPAPPAPEASDNTPILLSGSAAQADLVERWAETPGVPDEPARNALSPAAQHAVRQTLTAAYDAIPPDPATAPSSPVPLARLPEHPEILPGPVSPGQAQRPQPREVSLGPPQQPRSGPQNHADPSRALDSASILRSGAAAQAALGERWARTPGVPGEPAQSAQPAAARRAVQQTLTAAYDAAPPEPGTAPSAPVPLARLPERPEILPGPTAPAAHSTAQPTPLRQRSPIPPQQPSTTQGAAQPPSTAILAPAKDTRSSKDGLLLQRYASEIRTELLRRRFYPEAARQSGLGGEAVLELTLSRDGALRHAVLLQSSGSALLDAAARETARRGRFGPAPSDLRGTEFRFRVPLVFRMP